MRIVALFEIVVGAAMAGMWLVLVATHQVPEIVEGRRDIWFHIAAELLTAGLLLGAGVAVLVTSGTATVVLSAVAAGALLYTTVNSPGYYAARRQWPVVGMFGLLAAATAISVIVLVGGR